LLHEQLQLLVLQLLAWLRPVLLQGMQMHVLLLVLVLLLLLSDVQLVLLFLLVLLLVLLLPVVHWSKSCWLPTCCSKSS
jgi:hypothetical protein